MSVVARSIYIYNRLMHYLYAVHATAHGPQPQKAQQQTRLGSQRAFAALTGVDWRLISLSFSAVDQALWIGVVSDGG